MSTTFGEFVALVVVLFLGAWGWGNALVVGVERLGWEGARRAVNPPLQIALGVALFCCVGGYLVALGIGRFPVLFGWHLFGTCLLVAGYLDRRAQIRAWWDRRRVGIAVGCGLVSVYVSFLALGGSIGTPAYNAFDDDGAYIYLAQRLLSTGGLIDPFNQRRLVDYGAGTLYQAMFLQVGGNSAPRAAEYLFAALLVGLLGVGTLRRRLPVLAALVVGVGVVIGYGMGPAANEAPSFSGAALALATALLLVRVHADHGRRAKLGYLLVGLLLAGVLSLRVTLILASLVTVAFAVLFGGGAWRSRLRALVLAGAALIVSSLGWAVANYRSSGTPLFPLLKGNYETSFPGSAEPGLGLGGYAHHLLDALRAQGIAVILVVAVVVLVVLSRFPQRRSQVTVLAGAVLGTVLELIGLVATLAGAPLSDVVRFVSPSTMALALLSLGCLWPTRPEEQVAPPLHARAERRRPLGAIASLVVIAVLLVATFGHSLSTLHAQLSADVEGGRRVLDGTAGFVDRYAFFRPEYQALNAAIPTHADVLAAVDLPALLDMSKYTVATLDIVGSVSPPPSLPLFAGTPAIVAYLRHLGIGYVAVDDSGTSFRGLYDVAAWQADIDGPVYEWRRWALDFIAWGKVQTELQRDYPTRHFGHLALVDIGAAR